MNNQEASSSNNQKEENNICPNCLRHSNITYENCTIINNYNDYKSDV